VCVPAAGFESQAADSFAAMVEAQVWTVIGLLAATLTGSLVYLGGRIDRLGTSLGGRIDSLGTSLGGRINSQGTRLDGRLDVLASEIRDQSSRIDGLSGRVDGLSARVEEQGARLSEHMYELAIKLDEHLRRHAS
jgi:hypothetical protein